MKKLNRRMLRMIMDAKGQNIAVAIVIAIGLMMFVALTSAITNLDDSVQKYFEMTNAADIYIEIPAAGMTDVEGLENLSGVEDAQGRIVRDVRCVTGQDEKATLRVISVPDNDQMIHSLYFHSSEADLTSERDAYLIESFTRARGIELNDAIHIQYSGEDYYFDLKGIVSSSEYIYLMESEQSLLPDFKNFGILYVQESYALKTFSPNGMYNQILVRIKPGFDPEVVKKSIERKLESKGVQAVYVRNEQLSSRMVNEEIKGNRKTTAVVPAIFLGIASAIMYVMIGRMVRNDKISIGILKGMGFRNRQIMVHYSLYAVSIGLVGAALGILAGNLVSVFVTRLYATESFNIPMMTFQFHAWMLYAAVGMSFVFSVTAGLAGARGVVRIDPAVAMRPDAPQSGKHLWLERTRLWRNWMTFTEKMVIRNVFRNKKRIIVLSIGIALTYVVIIMPIFLMSTFLDMFEFQYGTMQRLDYSVNLSHFSSDGLVRNLDEYDAVEYVEGKLEYPFEAINGYREKSVMVIGLEEDSRIYHFYDAATGLQLKSVSEGIYINEGLAKILGVNVGDELTLKAYLPDKDHRHYKITALIRQNLGANIYMPMSTLQKDFFGPDVINGVYLNAKPQIRDTLNKAENVSGILSIQDMKDSYKDFLKVTYISIYLIVVVGILLGVAIVYNSIILLMNERTIEIASMRVLGVTIPEIFSIFTREIFIIGLFGILLGLPLSHYTLQVISDIFSTELYSFSADIKLAHYLSAAGITLFTIMLSLGMTYRKIKHSSFVDALKNQVT